jgi:hypothetical protein
MQPSASVEGRARAWVAASLTAGPAFVVAVMAVPLIRANAAVPWSLLFLIPIAIAFGLLVATVPAGILVWTGGWLGARWPMFRHPVIWGGVGAAAGVALGAAADVTRLADGWQGALAGAAVAGIARRLVRWRDAVAL